MHAQTVRSFAAVLAFSAAAIQPQVGLTQERELTAAYNASGQELFERLAGRRGNIVISPYSIGTAMAMALSGARGDTESELLAALRHSLQRPAIEAANARVLVKLNSYDQSKTPPTCPSGLSLDGNLCKGPRLAAGGCPFPARPEGGQCVGPAKFAPSAKVSVANALMLTKSGKVAPEYAALLKDKYAAEIFRDAQLADVNTWVKRKTEGKIEKIIDQLDPDTQAVLLNAVYFKAGWLAVFDKRNTADKPFHLTAASQIPVPTMHRTGSYAVTARSGYRAIRLPYAVRELSLIVVVPDKVDGVQEVLARLDGVEFSQMLAAVRAAPSTRVELALPRFKATYKANLVPPFKDAGIKLAFSDAADFSGMTGHPASKGSLKIDQIVHNAVIEVDEQGTEAAAATAITMVPTSAMPQPPEPFRVDRPFLFYLVDDATGAILFQGRIMDPRS
ncbi:MAG TPA: serpin family protein [Xanthobacteraceae bacterium]|nr:serpin family protein [Xanthobacteraceae bacterium]